MRLQEGYGADGIRKMFEKVHRRYRLVNHLLTLGMDRFWRARAAGMAAGAPAGRWLDICSGTGDMAARLKAAAPEGTAVYALDFTMPMIRTARKDRRLRDVRFVLGDARKLPFADRSFNLLTVSFSTRNMNLSEEVLLETFREFLRVLQPGGLFINLETSQPSAAPVRKLFHLLVGAYVAPAGRLISGAGPAYRYLSQSIPRFYPPEKLQSMISGVGFTDVSYRPLTLGAVAVHRAVKPRPG
ncbi:MAG: ubiquinone/menaquinone biosynthesis methyltransferase [Candidatus Latescibacteria bacterium]|nr:ubiquinone/menaquinone biosynthesis methyltransferase [bacterium]MBD3422898.1 ubiquinone/menaquinone biosynthesis methyltransferase [Candidatus Latescibacterota bacterium]